MEQNVRIFHRCPTDCLAVVPLRLFTDGLKGRGGEGAVKVTAKRCAALVTVCGSGRQSCEPEERRFGWLRVIDGIAAGTSFATSVPAASAVPYALLFPSGGRNMQTFKIIAFSCLFAFGLMLGLNVYAEDKIPEGAMRVVLTTVKVAETKADGSSWDVNGGKPDIFVSMKNLSDKTQKEVVTDVKNDTYEATFNSKMVLVAAGHRLRILVEDKDLAANDLIGKTELEVTPEMLKKGKVTISFGQVKELTMEFHKP
jgi:hypothetical protein